MVRSPQAIASRIANVTLVVLFLAALVFPMCVKFFGLESASLNENRVLAARPELKFERDALAQFPAQFDAYFNDNFGLRNKLIRWNNIAKVRGLGVSSSSLVLMGRAGWLYFTGDCSVEDIRRTSPFTDDDLETWRLALQAKRDWLAARGIRYLAVVAPSKHTIYPEFVPKSVSKVREDSRLDQLTAYLRARSDVTFLDLREPLLKSKEQGPRLYFRRDTHWNGRGAFIGYQATVAALTKWFPNVQPWAKSDFEETRVPRVNPDLSLMLGLGDVMTEYDFSMQPKIARHAHPVDPGALVEEARQAKRPIPVALETDIKDLPRAVVFGDSFFGFLVTLLPEHFSRTLFLWNTTFNPSIIEKEHPQVVIEEFVERRLFIPPSLPPDMAAKVASDVQAAKLASAKKTVTK